ncbi:MAG: hypothetical protein NTY35_08095 [Planctomycetota bacterium]|nr:hypothetical protein [Planctomycetota bacterium]
MTTHDPRARLLRPIAWAIFAAAVLSAPGFLIAERFEPGRVVRIAASNGLAALGALALVRASAGGRALLGCRVLVYGLLLLVGWLAGTGGEEVHVNVVNFVLVTVLAGTLLERADLALVAAASACVLAAIAWRGASDAPEATGVFVPFLESIAQFLPTYAVIVFVLWIAMPMRNLLSPPSDTPASP